MYRDVSALCHPLVSRTAVKDWTGSRPLFTCCVEKTAADSSLIVAKQARGQGVEVTCELSEAMPHIFFL